MEPNLVFRGVVYATVIGIVMWIALIAGVVWLVS